MENKNSKASANTNNTESSFSFKHDTEISVLFPFQIKIENIKKKKGKTNDDNNESSKEKNDVNNIEPFKINTWNNIVKYLKEKAYIYENVQCKNDNGKFDINGSKVFENYFEEYKDFSEDKSKNFDYIETNLFLDGDRGKAYQLKKTIDKNNKLNNDLNNYLNKVFFKYFLDDIYASGSNCMKYLNGSIKNDLKKFINFFNNNDNNFFTHKKVTSFYEKIVTNLFRHIEQSKNIKKSINDFKVALTWLQTFYKYFYVKNRSLIRDIILVAFNSNICFVIIKFSVGYIKVNEPKTAHQVYFDICLALRNLFKYSCVSFLVKDLFGLPNLKSIEGFDKWEDLGSHFYICKNSSGDEDKEELHKVCSYRPTLIANISIELNETLNLIDTQLIKISNWVCNIHSVKNNINEPLIKNISLYYNNFVTCTEDGLCYLTLKCKENIDLIKNLDIKNGPTLFQKVLFSYILNIHQYYYLHKLRNNILESSNLNKDSIFNILKKIQKLNKELAIFKEQYYFILVSKLYKIQEMYTYIFEQLHIEFFHNEIEKSHLPLFNNLDQKIKSYIMIATFVFDFITVILGIVNIILQAINFVKINNIEINNPDINNLKINYLEINKIFLILFLIALFINIILSITYLVLGIREKTKNNT